MTVLAWHFVDGKLRNGDPLPADGEVLRWDLPLNICRTGLHASEQLLDALSYAPGNTICRVECDEIGERQDDKFVCRQRTILWRVEAEQLLRNFARQCALDVIHLWDAPDVVREYLTTGDESLRDAARDAAWAAGRAAARDAAWDAAWDAARAAGRAAARDAAWAAVRAAAWDADAASRDAARAAAWDAQEKRLVGMVMAAHDAMANT